MCGLCAHVPTGTPLPPKKMNHTSSESERYSMAQVVAEITSGVEGAIPELDDYERADKLIAILEADLSKD